MGLFLLLALDCPFLFFSFIRNVITLNRLSIGTLETMNFPFVTNGKLMFFYVSQYLSTIGYCTVCRLNDKQFRPLSDCSSKSSLIWIFSVSATFRFYIISDINTDGNLLSYKIHALQMKINFIHLFLYDINMFALLH